MSLQDTPDLLGPAVRETLDALPLTPADAAAAQLAVRYAAEIDDSYGMLTLNELGPKLLATLTELGATPVARARQAKGGQPAGAVPTQLDRLRAARAGKRQ